MLKTSIDTARRITLEGPAMGSRWTAVIHAAAGAETAPLAAALAAAATRVDRQMTTWDAASDLMRLNAAACGVWVALPPDILMVLEAALRISEESEGLFDIGIGGLVSAWGFGPARGRIDEAAIRAQIGKPLTPAGWTAAALELDRKGGRARKAAAMRLDLSGIAKGFGVDALAQVCTDFGLQSWLVGIDGEMRAGAAKPDGSPWAVSLEKPVPGVQEPMGVITLCDRAVATSGDYRHFVQVGTSTLSHTMNPHTGGPVQNAVASVSVLAPTCMEADAWATVLMVMGERAGPAFAQARGMEAIFVVREAGGFRQITVGSGDPHVHGLPVQAACISDSGRG